MGSVTVNADGATVKGRTGGPAEAADGRPPSGLAKAAVPGYNEAMEIALAIVVFVVCAVALATGLLLKGNCLRGSCGGEPARIAGVTLSCGSCPKRDECDTPEAGEPAAPAAADDPLAQFGPPPR